MLTEGEFSLVEAVTYRVRWRAKQGRRRRVIYRVPVDLLGENHSQVCFSSLYLLIFERYLGIASKYVQIYSFLYSSC